MPTRVSDAKSMTDTKMENNTHRVWVRVGGYIELCDKDIDTLLSNCGEYTKGKLFHDRITDTFRIDGECNIPCEVNDCIDDDIDITI